jgi:hypothetical protein
MKFTATTNANEKVKSLVGILFLLFLLDGCAYQRGRTQTCSEVEKAVTGAENQYNDAFLELGNGSKDQNIIRSAGEKIKNLQEAQEKAFEVCNQFN